VQDRPTWVPKNGDVERPNSARLYDYLLGGAHNFAVDRALAEEHIRVLPADEICRSSRSFLRRVVRLCVASGVRQFLDLGSGIPTAGNVHEVAQLAEPSSRVVYVDDEAVTVAHSRAMLKGNPRAAIAHADVRDHAAVLNSPEVRSLIDLDEPVALLMFGILPFLTGADEAAAVVAGYREAAAPGSLIAVSHFTADVEPALATKMVAMAAQRGTPITVRSKDQIATLFDGLELLEPGLVIASQWRGDGEVSGSPAAESVSWGAVGRVPHE
jgi:hypothetical protein